MFTLACCTQDEEMGEQNEKLGAFNSSHLSRNGSYDNRMKGRADVGRQFALPT